METRLAVGADAADLAVLHGESFGDAKWSLDQIAGSLALPSVRGWVIETQGFILCQSAGGEAEILTFCVIPSARRKGIGARLLEAVLDHCRQDDIRRMFLEVAADNDAARGLYEKYGFRITGKRAGYYLRGGAAVDAVMYSLDL